MDSWSVAYARPCTFTGIGTVIVVVPVKITTSAIPTTWHAGVWPDGPFLSTIIISCIKAQLPCSLYTLLRWRNPIARGPCPDLFVACCNRQCTVGSWAKVMKTAVVLFSSLPLFDAQLTAAICIAWRRLRWGSRAITTTMVWSILWSCASFGSWAACLWTRSPRSPCIPCAGHWNQLPFHLINLHRIIWCSHYLGSCVHCKPHFQLNSQCS